MIARSSRCFVALCFAGFVASVTSAGGRASAAEPPVPPGPASAGVMVALLGTGVDYRIRSVHEALARDGEGVPIAWDFSDSDNRPFGLHSDEAAILAADARLVVVKENTGDPRAVGHMIAFAVQTPARVIVWPAADPARQDWPILAEAIDRFKDRLFVIPAPPTAVAVSASSAKSQAKDNLIRVAAKPGPASGGYDLLVGAPDPGHRSIAGSSVAAAKVAALAARILAAEPGLSPGAVRRRVLGLDKVDGGLTPSALANAYR